MSTARHSPDFVEMPRTEDGVFLVTTGIGALVVGGMIRKRKEKTFELVEEVVLVLLMGRFVAQLRKDRLERSKRY